MPFHIIAGYRMLGLMRLDGLSVDAGKAELVRGRSAGYPDLCCVLVRIVICGPRCAWLTSFCSASALVADGFRSRFPFGADR